MKNIYIYIHVCCINNWRQIFDQLLSDIKHSGLYDVVTEIRCNILTTCPDEDTSHFVDTKLRIIGVNGNLSAFETPTINALLEHAKTDPDGFDVLYIHSKGVRWNNTNECVTDWVKYLSYFNIYKYADCLAKLREDKYDAVGVNLQTQPSPHYSGNFWWASSSHLNTLQQCEPDYYAPEMWIAGRNDGKYAAIWCSNKHHYNERYDTSEYADQGIQLSGIH